MELDKQKQKEVMEKLLDLFSHEGWEIFQSDVEGNLMSFHKNVFSLNTGKDFFKYKGAVEALMFIRNYEKTIKSNYEQLQQEEDEDDDI